MVSLTEYQSDVDVLRPMPEILSQHSASLIENNTIDYNSTEQRHKEHENGKDEDFDEKSEKEHLNYGHVDDTKSKYAPKFKHPSKLFDMEMKPAGSSIRFKCAAEGIINNLQFITETVTNVFYRIYKLNNVCLIPMCIIS